MTDLWSDLLDCLDLRPLPGAPGTAASFEGGNQRLTYHRLFGGQLLAQSVTAARLACPGKSVKSLHVLFPRAGTAEEPVRYEVELHHEGRTFASLTIRAVQPQAGVIAIASVSLHANEDGRDHQTIDPVPAVPGPEHVLQLGLLPWETRSAIDLDSPKPEPPELELWMRTPATDPALATAVAAYATDLTLIGTALRPIDGVSQRDAGTAFTSAVTSHSVWFHRPFRTDGWLLLRQHSPLLAHGRGFGRGDLLTEDGSLVASYAQESLVRFQS
ncbi:thioesterase family protein [Actinomadura barringtoniae]|uniref:Thioesterase family protein n=1 Tax=Actinomadura barringtoniae TaxID=1427535 RepID=A0A939T1H7_9ACTN|nr:acyl-CoA thioesterase domain-containing protein [Actinomadura barringtoniae]MBO2447636.1 thioesterase family protein [Actinomadura barringtoniae]